MRSMTHVELAVGSQLLPNVLDDLFHGSQASVAVLATEYRRGRWIVCTKDVSPDFTVNSVAPNYAVMACFGAIHDRRGEYAPFRVLLRR